MIGVVRSLVVVLALIGLIAVVRQGLYLAEVLEPLHAMGFVMPTGGVSETAATTFFAILFLFAVGKAFLHIRRRELSQHRAWMIRAFAIGLAVATARPIVAMFFVFTDLSFQEFFGTALWLGFTLHLVLAEVWINYTRPPSASRSVVKPERGRGTGL